MLDLSKANSIFELFAVFNFVFIGSKIFGKNLIRELFFDPVEHYESKVEIIKSNVSESIKSLTDVRTPSNKVEEKKQKLIVLKSKLEEVSKLKYEINDIVDNTFFSLRFPSMSVYSGLYCILMILIGMKSNINHAHFISLVINIYSFLFIFVFVIIARISKIYSTGFFLFLLLLTILLQFGLMLNWFRPKPFPEKLVWYNFLITLLICMGHFIVDFFRSTFLFYYIKFKYFGTFEMTEKRIDELKKEANVFISKNKTTTTRVVPRGSSS